MKKQTKNIGATQYTDIMINICFFSERISGEKTLTFIDVVVVMVIFGYSRVTELGHNLDKVKNFRIS